MSIFETLLHYIIKRNIETNWIEKALQWRLIVVKQAVYMNATNEQNVGGLTHVWVLCLIV